MVIIVIVSVSISSRVSRGSSGSSGSSDSSSRSSSRSSKSSRSSRSSRSSSTCRSNRNRNSTVAETVTGTVVAAVIAIAIIIVGVVPKLRVLPIHLLLPPTRGLRLTREFWPMQSIYIYIHNVKYREEIYLVCVQAIWSRMNVLSPCDSYVLQLYLLIGILYSTTSATGRHHRTIIPWPRYFALCSLQPIIPQAFQGRRTAGQASVWQIHGLSVDLLCCEGKHFKAPTDIVNSFSRQAILFGPLLPR